MNWTHDKLSFVLHHDLRISIKNRNIMKDYPQHVVNVLFSRFDAFEVEVGTLEPTRKHILEIELEELHKNSM